MKYENNYKFSILLLLLAVLISGCQKDFIETNNESYTSPVEPENLMKLGKKLDNPYDISVMKEAFKNITEVSKTGKFSGRRSMKIITDQEGDTLEFVEIPEDVIRVTHKYVRFKPRNQEEMDAITGDSTLVLFDHPLDYEIEEEGDYYHDPEVHDTLPTPQYATVKISQQLNDTIPFEILSELYLPEEDAILDPELLDDPDNDQVVTVEETTTSKSNPLTSKALDKQALKSFASKGKTKEKVLMMDALVAEAFRLTNNEVEEDKEDKMFQIGSGQTSRWFGRRRKWTPRGTILAFDDVLNRNVPLQGIRVKGWRWFTRRSAIANSRGYYSMGRVRKKHFKYSLEFDRHHFQIRNPRTAVGHTLAWVSGNRAASINMGKHRRNRLVNRTLRSGYEKYLADIFRGAMLYYYGNIDGLQRPPLKQGFRTQMKIMASNENNPHAIGLHKGAGFHSFLGFNSRIYMYSRGRNSRQTFATMVHELAHASHKKISRYNYRNTSDKVKESWARGVEYHLTRKIYPDYIGGANVLPLYTSVVVDMIDNRAPLNAYGRPLNINQGSEILTQDDVSGYTIRQIEATLNGSRTWSQWRDNIKRKYNNATEDNLDALFNHWN